MESSHVDCSEQVERRAMATTRYTDEEIARRAEALYEREIRPKVEGENKGKILVIDIETGAYEIDDDLLQAAHRVRAKNPGAVLYSLRIGFPALAKMGGSWGVAGR